MFGRSAAESCVHDNTRAAQRSTKRKVMVAGLARKWHSSFRLDYIICLRSDKEADGREYPELFHAISIRPWSTASSDCAARTVVAWIDRRGAGAKRQSRHQQAVREPGGRRFCPAIRA